MFYPPKDKHLFLLPLSWLHWFAFSFITISFHLHQNWFGLQNIKRDNFPPVDISLPIMYLQRLIIPQSELVSVSGQFIVWARDPQHLVDHIQNPNETDGLKPQPFGSQSSFRSQYQKWCMFLLRFHRMQLEEFDSFFKAKSSTSHKVFEKEKKEFKHA